MFSWIISFREYIKGTIEHSWIPPSKLYYDFWVIDIWRFCELNMNNIKILIRNGQRV